METAYSVAKNELLARRMFTPDQKELEAKAGHLVFVWDNFKVGFPWDTYFFVEKYLGSAFTVENTFIMYNNETSPPVLIQNSKKDKDLEPHQCRVVGDVYYTDWRKIAQLDAIMANGFDFKRVERYVALKDQRSPFVDQNRKTTVKAWMYLNTEDFFNKQSVLVPATKYSREEGFAYDWMKYEAHHLGH